MADKKERAQLGEQSDSEPMVARPSQADSNDRNAGDEGIDDSRTTVARDSRISRKSGMKTASGDANQASEESGSDRNESDPNNSDRNQSDRSQSNSNREPARNESSMRGAGTSGDSGEFDGQGGQKEGNSGNAKGTGYTNDRTGQLQEDGSLSGSQGKQGNEGNRKGTGTSESERVGGQTAQNPRK